MTTSIAPAGSCDRNTILQLREALYIILGLARRYARSNAAETRTNAANAVLLSSYSDAERAAIVSAAIARHGELFDDTKIETFDDVVFQYGHSFIRQVSLESLKDVQFLKTVAVADIAKSDSSANDGNQLFKVTLDWGQSVEDGDYCTSVWAADADQAIRFVAEEMADSRNDMNDAKRAAFIERRIEGARKGAAVLVKDDIVGDIETILKTRPDAAKAIKAILNGAAFTELSVSGGIDKDFVEAKAALERATSTGDKHLADFKNFHRLLCDRFGYGHDSKDWQRDQLSLIEWIAKHFTPPAPPAAY